MLNSHCNHFYVIHFYFNAQAKAPILLGICTKGGSAPIIIKSVGVGNEYHVDMLLNGKVVGDYYDVGDCALLYSYGITNVSAKVKASYTYMEEYDSTKTCKITDIELTPDHEM